MQFVLIGVSVLLILIVLLQSGKAESASNIISGGNNDLFNNRKERGGELFMSRLTLFLGITYIVLCILL